MFTIDKKAAESKLKFILAQIENLQREAEEWKTLIRIIEREESQSLLKATVPLFKDYIIKPQDVAHYKGGTRYEATPARRRIFEDIAAKFNEPISFYEFTKKLNDAGDIIHPHAVYIALKRCAEFPESTIVKIDGSHFAAKKWGFTAAPLTSK